MKTGPKDGLYKRLLEVKFKGKLPRANKALYRTNPREHSRRKAVRALHRRIEHADKFKKLAKWVRAMRRYTKKSRKDFAKLVGVSRSTLVRWELALGSWPAEYRKGNHASNWERLESIADTIEQLKKTKTPFEG